MCQSLQTLRLRRHDAAAKTLEALAMHNRGARFFVVALGDPHLLECRKGCENRSTDPDGVFALGRCHDLRSTSAISASCIDLHKPCLVIVETRKFM